MLKSMTGFSKAEAKENGTTVNIEIKSLNGRYLELKCKLPRQHSIREIEIRDMVKQTVDRGTVQLFINLESDNAADAFDINQEAAIACYNGLKKLKTKMKIKEAVQLDHVLHFSQNLVAKDESVDEEAEWKLIKKVLRTALKSLDNMRKKEGKQIGNDIQNRVKLIGEKVEIIDEKGIERIPEEREKLRQRVARLFESDEIDEQRLQLELVLLADKLDISEECVRLRSHVKFFNEALKANEPVGKKLNFLLQEMHREINTVGSKASNAGISNYVIEVKEELERIREQVQNIE